MYQAIDETGNVYHWLTVLDRCDAPPHITGNRKKNAWFRCRCKCGNERICCGADLRKGGTKSCGCYRVKRVSRRANDLKEHPQLYGRHGEDGYQLWTRLLRVCEKPDDIGYAAHGGRGYSVHWLWRNSSDSFMAWLDREGYEPGQSVIMREGETVYAPWTCYLGSKSDCISKSKRRQSDVDYDSLPGQTFGFLTVLAEAPREKGKPTRWVCRCVCGNETVVSTSHLLRGGTLSCGCRGRVSEWSIKYACCRNCNGTGSPYTANGLCRRCYNGLMRDPDYTPDPRLDKKDRWSLKYDRCKDCGETSRKHSQHGYCTRCVQRWKKRTRLNGA